MEQPALISLPLKEIQVPIAGAGFWVRVGARVVDTITHNVIWYVTSFLIGIAIGLYGMLTGAPVSQLFSQADSSPFMGFVLALVGSIFYHTTCEYLAGASLGKLLFKLYVKSEDGQRISLMAAFIRSCAYFVDGIFFGIIAYESMKISPLRQRLGDRWAKTVVVERANLLPSQIPSGWTFLLALIAAILVDGFIALISILLALF